jgi:hypothetical protein
MRDTALQLEANGLQAVSWIATGIVHPFSRSYLASCSTQSQKYQGDCSKPTVIDTAMTTGVREDYHQEARNQG